MSLLPSQTNINLNEYFFLRGTGQQLNVSTLNANNISTATLAASSIVANDLTAGHVSSIELDAEVINASTISTIALDLDGQLLTATPSELLLNGVPLATTSNLSSIADWSLDPAISTVQMNGNGLNAASFISTGSIVGGTAFFTQLMAINSMFLSTFTSTLSSVVNVADEGLFSTISTGTLFGGNVTPSTLWGQPSSFYQTALSTINSGDIVCSTLTAATRISTPDLEVSSINGHEFTENTATISSIISNNISSVFGDFTVNLVSTLQFNPSFDPSLDVNLGLGSLFGNLAGAALGGIGVLVGGAALGTGIAALTQSRQTKTIGNSTFELVNGATQLQVSTLGTAVSSIQRLVSSIDEQTPGEEIFISSIIPAGTVCLRSYSDPLNTVSTPNSTIQYFGQWVSLDEVVPPASTISTFNQLLTSSIGVSTVAFDTTLLRTGSTFLGTSAVPSLELYWPASSPPLDADMRVGALIISGNDVGGLNASKDVLIQNANNGQRLQVFGPAGTSVSTIAFLSDIPAPQPTVSSFQDLGTNDLRVSTINMEGTGTITWDNNASIYEVSAGRLFITAGSATNIDLEPTQISFSEGGAGGLMRFFDNHLEVSAVSTLNVDAQQGMATSTLTVSSINGGIPFTTANPPPIADTSTILVSSIGSIGNVSSLSITPNALSFFNIDTVGRFTEVGRSFNSQAQSTGTLLAELLLDSTAAGGNGLFRLAAGVGNINASTINMSTSQLRVPAVSTNTASASLYQVLGLSTIQFSTATVAGVQSQPPGRLIISGNDLDLGQQDLWAQQVRLGAANPLGSAQTEVIWYGPDNTTRGLGLGSADTTLRLQSTINVGTNNGYLLDTTINPPFFSTLAGTSTALMAVFPSTSLGSIGVSTLSILPPLPAAAFFSRSTQTVVANTPLTLWHEVAGVSLGSAITQSTNTLVIGQAGVYDIETSIQFDKSGGGVSVADFWFRKNGVDIPDSASEITVQGNTGEVLGNVSILESFAAGDKLELVIASADNTLGATFFQSTVTTPYTRPAIPSVITNIKKLG